MGFFMWYVLSSSRAITTTITLPVYFDNALETINIDAPEDIAVTVSGTRTSIQACLNEGALHVDAAYLSAGKHLVHLTHKNFLLPRVVKLLNYMPIEVTLTSQEH